MQTKGRVELRVDGDDVLVSHDTLRVDRTARMFFSSILGAKPTDNGWRCPRRRQALGDLVVRINTFLESHGWWVDRQGIADEAVMRDLERIRSFARTRGHAAELRDGRLIIDLADVLRKLRLFGWDDETRPLLKHQQAGLVHALTATNAANFSVPGSGKTATTLAVAAAHLSSGTIDLVLVVGPLSCFAPWETELRAALPGKLIARRVRGSAGERAEVYASARRLDLLLVSFATAASDRALLIELCRRSRVMLVVDESHRVKRFRGGLWAPALIQIARYARVKTILSGTPMPQSPRDLYSQLNILWPGQELTGPRDGFAARVERDFGPVLNEVRPFVSRTPKSALGLQSYNVIRHRVPLESTQAEIYALIESNFRRRIDGAATYREKIDVLRRGKPIRLLQAASNPDLLNKLDNYYSIPRVNSPNPTLMERLSSYRLHDIPAKSVKGLEILRGVVASGSKAVVWSNFIANLDQFSDLVRSDLSVPCFQVDGRVRAGDETVDDEAGVHRVNPEDADTRERIIDSFLTQKGPAVLVANPASCSESISLHTSCHTAIYLDRTYDCALYLQSIDRIHRLGLPKDVLVTVHIIQALLGDRLTVDGLVDASLDRKEVAMKRLLEGAELLPIHLSDKPLDTAEGDDQDLAEMLHFLLGEE